MYVTIDNSFMFTIKNVPSEIHDQKLELVVYDGYRPSLDQMSGFILTMRRT